MAERTFLVTGALGCIGAWVLYHLVEQGERVVAFDLSDDRQRVDLLLTPAEQEAISFVHGDLTDRATVAQTVQTEAITHIIHLAALQVPFCRADPARGAQVNVGGTVHVFEAARAAGIEHLAYASSIAVYGPASDYPPDPVAHEALPAPRTLYGVYKVANEGTARVYWQDWGLSSTALRPYTVYGLGRDQGLTSDPTKAMRAAARGERFQINFGGRMQFQWASDVARQFILAATEPLGGAFAFNLGATPVTVAELVDQIKQLRPAAQITFTENRLPFPESFDDSALRAHAGVVYETPLADGIRHTIEGFAARGVGR